MALPVLSVPLQLSQAQPDFESIVLQLQLYLSQKTTWVDTLTSSTGQTLIEMMAAVGTFNQFAIESAAREAFLDTAIRDSSIYAATRMLGVRISRKAPAGTDVVLTRKASNNTSFVLPRFSQFDINGQRFFNRDPIVFQANNWDSDACILYEGTLKIQTLAANSQAFREIYLNEPGFVVSNYDLDVVLIDNSTGARTLWASTEDGIWTSSAGDKVYYDTTSGLGDTILAFGDGYHGALPSVGFTIEITYCVTSGAAGNIGGAGIALKSITDPNIIGVTVSPINGGADEKPARYYRSLAPNLYKARTRAVTAPDYKAIASSYPGVASVAIQSQRDIAPGDLRWMNVTRMCILPEFADHFSTSEWSSFLAWFIRKEHCAIHLQKYDPIKLYADIVLTLALLPTAVSATVLVAVEANLRSLFVKSLSTLGKRIAVSDIVDACTAVNGVDYVEVALPASDFVCPTILYYYELRDLKLSTIYSERTFYNVDTFRGG